MIQGSLNTSKMLRNNGPYSLQPKLGLGTPWRGDMIV